MKNSYLTVTDQFCGAGGTSSGVKAAGLEVKMALNHWKLAIETHNTNHPEVDHDCTDISACNPARYPSTNMLFTSPECTNHSLAKGRKKRHQNQFNLFQKVEIKPEEERSRATMWDVPRFAEYHDYEIIVVENVVDARDWICWGGWLKAMHAMGYDHKCLYFNSMFFHPCPQSRDRMYVVFWKKNNPAPDLEFRPVAPCPECGDRECFQSWKNPQRKYGKYKTQYVYRCSKCMNEVVPYFYCAMNIIDWSVPIQRIGDRKKPLVPKTIKRIQYGLDKYGHEQLIVTGRYTSGLDCRVKVARETAFPTQPGAASHFLLSSVNIVNSAYDNNVRTAQKALFTQTTRQEQNLLLTPPSIVTLRNNSKAKRGTESINTVSAGGIHAGLLFGNYSPGWSRTLDKPTGTMTTTAQKSLLTSEALNSFLSYYYGQNTDSSLGKAINTMTTVDRAAIVQMAPNIEDCYYRVIKSHEVQRAMAFEDSYIVLGNQKQRVKQLGNAVTPPVAKWIAERCIQSLS